MAQRVELAGLVTDEQGRYLVVRGDNNEQWRLPGGPIPEGVDADIAMRGYLREAGLAAGPMAEAFVATLYLRDNGDDVTMSVYATQVTATRPESAVERLWVSASELAEVEMTDTHRQVAKAYRSGDAEQGVVTMENRRERGLDVLRTLTAASDPVAAGAAMEQNMPGLGEPIIDFALGEVWSSETLDRKTRSLQVVAMTAALGRPDALRAHVAGALNHGATAEEIVETLRMVAVYAGFPASLDAWPIMAAVFEQRGIAIPGKTS